MPTTTTIPQPEPLPASPKRKRPAKEPHSGPFPSRLKTSHLPPRPRPRPPPPNISFHNSTQRPGSSSPRTAVAGNLQKLDLSASNEELTALDFSPSELPLDSHPSVTPFTSPAPGIVSANREGGEREVLEIPETPRLKPVKSSEQVELLLGAKRRGDEEGERPLDTGEKLWWSEGEITGHQLDVKDEGDDGEGINGVGFLPTPAQSYARSLRRKRQVKDWKEREAREARQKRSDRRRRRDIEEASHSAMNNVKHNGAEGTRKVRFLEA